MPVVCKTKLWVRLSVSKNSVLLKSLSVTTSNNTILPYNLPLYQSSLRGCAALLLAIDIGNTNVVAGVFAGKRLIAKWRLATSMERMPDEWGALLANMLRHKE